MKMASSSSRRLRSNDGLYFLEIMENIPSDESDGEFDGYITDDSQDDLSSPTHGESSMSKN